jgi:hypothetical protein
MSVLLQLHVPFASYLPLYVNSTPNERFAKVIFRHALQTHDIAQGDGL